MTSPNCHTQLLIQAGIADEHVGCPATARQAGKESLLSIFPQNQEENISIRITKIGKYVNEAFPSQKFKNQNTWSQFRLRLSSALVYFFWHVVRCTAHIVLG